MRLWDERDSTLIAELGDDWAGLPDRRNGPRRDGDYCMADLPLSAFSIFFMDSPAFLVQQRALNGGHGLSNCETLFGMTAIPSDNYIPLLLDGAGSEPSVRSYDRSYERSPARRLIRRGVGPFPSAKCSITSTVIAMWVGRDAYFPYDTAACSL